MPRWGVTSISVSPTSFSTGTVTLAKNTSSARGHSPASSSSCAPPRIVCGPLRPRRVMFITEYVLAGT